MTEILSRLIATIIEVIKKQMSEYLDGSLSNVSLATTHQTYSAPAHNFEKNLRGGILKIVAIRQL